MKKINASALKFIAENIKLNNTASIYPIRKVTKNTANVSYSHKSDSIIETLESSLIDKEFANKVSP